MRRTFFPLLACLLPAVVGCSGDRTAPVSGVVRMKGQPLAGATVTFIPSPGTGSGTAVAIAGADGSFQIQTTLPGGKTLPGAAPGDYRVVVSKMIPPGNMSEEEYAKKQAAEQDPNKPYSPTDGLPPKVEVVPKEYSSSASPKLTATVTADGPNRFEFEIP